MTRATGIADFADVPEVAEPVGRFVSLYSGAGGMDIGFALAGFTPVWANDFDASAMESHERIFKRLADERPHLNGLAMTPVTGSILDIIESGSLPERGSAELVIGGPPCQGFSVAGKMDPDDKRSQHVFRFLDVVDHVRPTAFVLENVKALYENRRWSTIRDRLRERANAMGFRTLMVCLNASHFGVPQARERMMFIGLQDRDPVMPTPTTAENPRTIREAFSQLPRYGDAGNDSFCTARITIAKTPVLRRSPFAGMLFNGAGRPMDVDGPSLTLPASMGGNKTPIVDQEQLDLGSTPWIVEHHANLLAGKPAATEVPRRLRRLTVQEAAALQTFPLGMDWAGPQSSQFRQIGNAVPPRLAYAVAIAVRDALTGSL